MERKKRGISPLLSAILLIGFVVALGAIVSTFLIKKAENFNPEAMIQDSILCDDVAIMPVIMEGKDQEVKNWDASANELNGIGFKNKGAFTIHKITITTPGYGSLEYVFYDDNGKITTLKPNDPAKEVKIYIRSENEENIIIKATPWIKDQEKENTPLVICTKKETRFNLKDLQKSLE